MTAPLQYFSLKYHEISSGSTGIQSCTFMEWTVESFNNCDLILYAGAELISYAGAQMVRI